MKGRLRSFTFSADRAARVLILGSMPGAESLRKGEYYAHPRNRFWDRMEDLFGAGRALPYEQRLAVLRANGIALWDAAHSCRRNGSLDASIREPRANDFRKLFQVAPGIHTVFFNGHTAAALFRRLVAPNLKRELALITLPSTSPANAGMSEEAKKAAWNQIRLALENPPADQTENSEV